MANKRKYTVYIAVSVGATSRVEVEAESEADAESTVGDLLDRGKIDLDKLPWEVCGTKLENPFDKDGEPYAEGAQECDDLAPGERGVDDRFEPF